MKPFRHHHRLLAAGLATALAVAAACSTKSPTEPGSQPISPKVPAPTPTFAVTVTASPAHLTIGSSTGSKINVRAVNVQDGTPPPDGTSVTLTTTLGEFNNIGSGLLTTNLVLVHGQAGAVLFPGIAAGTAALVATVLGSSGATNVVITSAGTFFLSGLSPSTGDPAGGAVVTISGGGFLAPVAVSFGGSSAGVKSVSPSAIVVIVPPSSTPVPVGTTLQVSVTVTNNLGGTQTGTATLTNAFTYVPGGGGVQQPLIFSVSPQSGTNDGGTQVTIVGEGFVAPVQVFFGSGTSPTSFNGIEATIQSVSATQIVVVTPPARGFGQDNSNQNVSILVKNTGSGFGTIAAMAFKYGSKVIVTSVDPTTTVFSQQVKVTVFGQGFASPVAVSLAGIAATVLSTSGTEIQVLSGVPVVSGCSNISGPVGVTNINNGDSGTGAGFTYLVPKPLVSGIFSCTSVSSCTGSPSGPQTGGTLLEILGSFPDPGATEVIISSETVFPNGSSTTRMLFVTTPAFTGTFPTQSCPSICGLTGTMNLPTTVPIQLTDSATTCSTTVQGAFTYIPTNQSCQPPTIPTLAASFTAMTTMGSNKVTLTNTTTGGAPPLSYLWDFGGNTDQGPTSTQQSPQPTYTTAGPHTINLTVRDCSGMTSMAPPVTVTVPGA
jgi:hypothetical protein